MRDLDARCRRSSVLRDIRQSFGDDVVRRRFDGRRQPARGDVDLDGQLRSGNERVHGRGQAAIREHGGVDPACELAKLVDRMSQLLACAADDLGRAGGIDREPRLGEPKAYGQRDEALLGSVVQVPLETLTGVVPRSDEACARRSKLLFVALAVADVAQHGHCADDLTGAVADRSGRDLDLEPSSITVDPDRLVAGVPDAGGLLRAEPAELVSKILRNPPRWTCR